MTKNQNDRNKKRRLATRHLLELCCLPLLTVLAWAGCKQNVKVATDADPVGTYTLVTVDGNKVPCALQHQGHNLTVKSGTFMINPEGTCTSTVVFGPPSGGEAVREVRATYTRQGSKLTMQWEGAGTTTGTTEGKTFTMNNEGMVFTYAR
jgi:hypothetical protein